MSMTHAAHMNLIATAFVAFGGLVALYRLDIRHRDRGRFLFRAFSCWLLAWACWAVLWGIVSFPVGPFTDSDFYRHSLLLLSDLNTALIVLFYLGLTRAGDITATGYVIIGTILATTFLSIDGLLLSFPGGIGELLQGRWSMALSMAAPVLVGWACMLRYRVSTVLIIGVLYAIGQPPAQEAVVGREIPADIAGIVLTLLAVFKILFGAAVTHVVGYEPEHYNSLLNRSETRVPLRYDDRWWPALPLVLAVVGGAAVLSDAAMNNTQLFTRIGGQVVAAVAFLAGLLKIFDFVASRIPRHRETGSGSPPAVPLV